MSSQTEQLWNFWQTRAGPDTEPWLAIPGIGAVRWLCPRRRDGIRRTRSLAVPGGHLARVIFACIRSALTLMPRGLPPFARTIHLDPDQFVDTLIAVGFDISTLVASLGRGAEARRLLLAGDLANGSGNALARLALEPTSDAGVRHEAAMLTSAVDDPFFIGRCPRSLGLFETAKGRPLHLQSRLVGTHVPVGRSAALATFLDRRPKNEFFPLRCFAAERPTAMQYLNTVLPTKRVESLLNTLLPMGLVHGDAATWNALGSRDGFVLFDWEYGCPKAPIGIDALHARLAPWWVHGRQPPDTSFLHDRLAELMALALHLGDESRRTVAFNCSVELLARFLGRR